ncbi:xylulokinase [Microterricola pindariensis]|uniref:Xylulose kinase n=1 Tax=Microterricola pindariensis TaxID=478010 RepID=A0ABX5AZZ1_9MICO|nr:xylulokinase [Microterricola pindariensis]PPL20387.1 xylulokinase [Microterricola pindariensis]
MIISHDLGTTGNKATLVSNDGTMVASVSVGYDADFGPGGRAQQNPHDWWEAMATANRLLLEKGGIANTEIDAVSFSGQMMGVVPVNGAGEPVRPAMIWADTRSGAQCDSLIERIGMERAYAITGHRLNPTYSLSKIMWLRDTEPEVFATIDSVLQAKDYLAYRLTGVRVTDPSDASSTNAYDQAAQGWSHELIEAAGLSASLFPEIVESTTVVGTVTAAAARETGLAVGTPVVIGGGDGPMAALGAGIIDASSGAYAYLGSSSWVSLSSDEPLHDPLMRSMTFNHVIPGRFVPTATMQAGGASLQWVTQLLSPNNDDRFAELLGAAASSTASEDGLFFLPHLLGERSPYWNPQARAAFVGMLMHHDRGNLTRAVLEGIAFNLNTGLRAFIDNGSTISSIDAIGGAAHSNLLLDIFADVWGVPVAARNLVDEANAIGAAVVAGVGVGIFDGFEAVHGFSSRTVVREPDRANHARYGGEYLTFMDAYRRLEPWFDGLGSGTAPQPA